jgi:transcriptional regulator with XRE-family HTH domain
MKTKHKTLTELLRNAIRQSGKSLRLIAKETGIERASLSRFMSEQTSLRLDKVDALCAYLGIEHTQREG